MTLSPADHERSRLEALRSYNILDTLAESAFDDLAILASHICQTPFALISLVDEHRQWFKAKVGLALEDTAREVSICAHAIRQSDVFIVPDTLQDVRFAQNPLVTRAPQVRFYAGAPLIAPSGHALGTLCVLDRTPRELSPDQQQAIRVLSRHVMAQLELRRSLAVRQEMERQLVAAQTRLRHVLGTCPSVIYTLKPDGETFVATWVSDNIVSLSGFSAEDSLQPGWWFENVHPDDRHRVSAEQAQARSADKCIQEYRFRHKDGRYLWVRDEQNFVRDDGGNLVEVIGSWSNVTKRKEAEIALQNLNEDLERRVAERTLQLNTANKELAKRNRELQQAAEQIRDQAALLDKAQDAIVVRDLDQQVSYWNLGAERIFGWSASEATGRSMYGLLLKGDVLPFQQACLTLLQEGYWAGELRLRHKDGHDLTVDSRWTLVRDADGNPKSILDITTDATERKLLEAKFLRAQRLESIGTLAGGVAHDLNNVLAPILMAIDLLKSEANSSSNTRLLETIKASAERGAAMVTQILSFARGVESKRVIVQMKHLVKDLMKIAKDTFPKSIRLQQNIAKELWPILGDPTQLYQVLMNLCVNARDAMPQGGSLEVRGENVFMDDNRARSKAGLKPGNYVAITVSDTGTGIPLEILERIFDPFFTTKEIGKGTGLGLSTSVGIVRSHGGLLDVESELGKGSRFRILLPAADPAASEKLEAVSSGLPAGQGETILIVDDELAVLEVAKTALETYGYRVLTASDGAEALGLYAQHKMEIQVVITDMMMPFLDGPATIRALQRMNPTIRVIATSGLSDREKLSRLENATNIRFLRKPYDAAVLLRTLRKTIQGE